MALNDGISFGSPDKQEESCDVTLTPRGVYDFTASPPTYTPKGYIRRSVITTTKTWVSRSLAVCQAAFEEYTSLTSGEEHTGSIRYMLQGAGVLGAYNLEVTESTTKIEFLDIEDVEEEGGS